MARFRRDVTRRAGQGAPVAARPPLPAHAAGRRGARDECIELHRLAILRGADSRARARRGDHGSPRTSHRNGVMDIVAAASTVSHEGLGRTPVAVEQGHAAHAALDRWRFVVVNEHDARFPLPIDTRRSRTGLPVAGAGPCRRPAHAPGPGGVGVAAWLASAAGSVRGLGVALAGAFAAGALAVAAARSLPVHVAGPGARLADGSGLGGSVVRVERRWPGRSDRLHVLLGNGRVRRGAVLLLEGGRPERYLRGR